MIYTRFNKSVKLTDVNMQMLSDMVSHTGQKEYCALVILKIKHLIFNNPASHCSTTVGMLVLCKISNLVLV